jgi:hypothetical protein
MPSFSVLPGSEGFFIFGPGTGLQETKLRIGAAAVLKDQLWDRIVAFVW